MSLRWDEVSRHLLQMTKLGIAYSLDLSSAFVTVRRYHTLLQTIPPFHMKFSVLNGASVAQGMGSHSDVTSWVADKHKVMEISYAWQVRIFL